MSRDSRGMLGIGLARANHPKRCVISTCVACDAFGVFQLKKQTSSVAFSPPIGWARDALSKLWKCTTCAA